MEATGWLGGLPALRWRRAARSSRRPEALRADSGNGAAAVDPAPGGERAVVEAEPPPVRRRGLSIAVVLTGVFLASLDLFIVNIAFPDLQASFRATSVSGLSWVLSAYAITFAALLMPAGRWADRSGRKRVYLAGLGLFTLASAACAAASSAEMLVAARVLQAVGAALMLPTSLGLLLPLFPPERRVAAVGLWSAVGGAAAAAGPPVGGLLVQADWRLVFLINIPIGIAAIAAGWWVLHEIRERSRAAPDVLGALVLAASVAALVAAIVQGNDWGWLGGRVLGLLALSALGLVYSVRRARRHPAPVVEPEILRIRTVALADASAIVFFAGFGAMIFSSALFLTGVWDRSILRAGIEFTPGPASAAVFALIGAGLVKRHGAQRVGLVGAVLFALGGVWWTTAVTATPDYAYGFIPGGLLAGAGAGLVLPSVSSAATLSLPPQRFATGAGLLSMCRQLGTALGVAVVAALLDAGTGVPAYQGAWLFMAGCGLVAGLVLAASIGDRAGRVVPQADAALAGDGKAYVTTSNVREE